MDAIIVWGFLVIFGSAWAWYAGKKDISWVVFGLVMAMIVLTSIHIPKLIGV